MNNVDDLNYSVNMVSKGRKILIEYNGKIFKDNPALLTNNKEKVNVKETEKRLCC